ncbi:DUF6151 family protein [Sulfitobacter sp. F26204]|uniref:DUF6151 family protein n=1 Tax=Sulfitobacter sp. F26204 TaxID=2996014 RepID=UPI00225DE6D9|nr:DUF6151 family protein [Sulfitobacter sp. F26204]MCX7559182.1 DUF6151 family protein [Sulfitobacter sp. F26204]
MADVPFTCRCGGVKGTLHNVGWGNHARCFCQSCRAADIHTGDPDPGDGGITVFQTTPDKITFETGQNKLVCFSFGPKNLLRWQAECCGALLFNTLRTPHVPFAALRTSRIPEPDRLGPVRSRGFIPDKNGRHRHEGMRHLVLGMIGRSLFARLTGRWKQTPFFDLGTSRPVAEVRVLPEGARHDILK